MIDDETLKTFWIATDIFEEHMATILGGTEGELHEYAQYWAAAFAERVAIATDLIVLGPESVPDELPPPAMTYDEWLMDRQLEES